MTCAVMISLSKFRCLRCGNCCRWHGAVRVDQEEIAAIAGFLGINENEFLARFTRLTDDRRGLSLLEKPDGSCLYLEGSAGEVGCQINPVKPRQCREFPYVWNFPGWEYECEGGRALYGK